MNVEQLATLEERWLSKQRSLTGDREVLYEQAGVYAAWRDIFEQYVTLAREGDMEALKRALFLAWAQRSIGPRSTGLRDLEEERIRETLDITDRRARDRQLDVEFEWMLPYYYVIEPAYLDRFSGLDTLKRVSGEHPFLYRQRCLESSFERRGHMGEYWKAKQAYLRRWP